MELAGILFTACALLACVLLTAHAHKCSREAEHARDELKTARGRLIANEHAIESLSQALHRTNGRVSKLQTRYPREHVLDAETDDDGDVDPDHAAMLRLQASAANGKG